MKQAMTRWMASLAAALMSGSAVYSGGCDAGDIITSSFDLAGSIIDVAS